MSIVKRLGLVFALLGCVVVAAALVQCGGDTSTPTTGTINSADGGNNNSGTGTGSPGPSGW